MPRKGQLQPNYTRDQAIAFIADRIAIEPITGCHEWQGSKTQDGYGQFGSKVMERTTGQKLVHRAMMVLTTGIEFTSRDQQTMHQCHNRSCCNPDHLEIGTAQENMAQARQRGTLTGIMARSGENHGKAKLTEAMVRTVKKMISDGVAGIDIASLAKVSTNAISAIKTGRTWKHVTI